MSGRPILPVIESLFDRTFDYAPPEPGPIPVTENRRLTVNREVYQLRRITMPDGEIRKFASQYNGYGDGSDSDRQISMRFGCAWTPAPIILGL